MMYNDLYQRILDEILPYLPNNWDKVVIHLEYGEDSYTFAFYVKSNGKYTKCYDLPGISEEDLLDTFDHMDLFVNRFRSEEKDPWISMTMVVDHDGIMHTDFDYRNPDAMDAQYKNHWKEKYLI